jgi:hypothetical protein
MEKELFDLAIRIERLGFHFDIFRMADILLLERGIKTPADHYSLRAFEHGGGGKRRGFRIDAQLNMLFANRALGVLVFRANLLIDQAKLRCGART